MKNNAFSKFALVSILASKPSSEIVKSSFVNEANGFVNLSKDTSFPSLSFPLSIIN